MMSLGINVFGLMELKTLGEDKNNKFLKKYTWHIEKRKLSHCFEALSTMPIFNTIQSKLPKM